MKQAIMLTQFKNEWHTLSKALQKSSSTRLQESSTDSTPRAVIVL
jgi:hypothetical protein